MKPKKTSKAVGVNKLRQEESAKELEIAIRRKRVLELIIARVPHSQIAETLKVSKGTIQSDKDAIMRELAESAITNAHEPFLTSLATLDAVQTAIFNRAMSGESDAVVLTLKIEARRAAMLGFDASDRARSGLRVTPPEPTIEVDTSEVLTSDGRPVGKGVAARLHALFTPRDTPDGGSGPASEDGDREVPTIGEGAQS